MGILLLARHVCPVKQVLTPLRVHLYAYHVPWVPIVLVHGHIVLHACLVVIVTRRAWVDVNLVQSILKRKSKEQLSVRPAATDEIKLSRLH